MSQSGPGKSYREGITLVELFRRFPDDRAAEEWFERCRWGTWREPGYCPLCGCTENISVVPSQRPLPYWCGDCRRNFSVKTGTVMHRSRIGYQKWAIAIYLWSVSLKGVSSMRLHRDLGITQKSAWFMAQRLREVWSFHHGGGMAGPVEIDEGYFGGRRKNMSNAKRRAVQGVRAPMDDKTAVVGIRDRATNQIDARVVERVDGPTMREIVDEMVDEDATVYTDESRVYSRLYRKHETVNHSVSEYVRGQASTNGVESFWAALKRAYHGTFHQISPKHLHRYVNEFAGRHNLRPRDTAEIMAEIAARMIGKRLTYRQLTRD